MGHLSKFCISPNKTHTPQAAVNTFWVVEGGSFGDTFYVQYTYL